MSKFKTLFSDAVVKSIPTTGSGNVSTDGARHLPEGLPGRTGGLIPEVNYDDSVKGVKPSREPGTDMWLLKK